MKNKLLETIKTIREFETEISAQVEKGIIKTPCHLSLGQEAVVVGVCSALRKTDVVYGTHRSHALYIAKGGNINKLRDEIYGKLTGCMKGKGGSMHLKAPEVGFVLCSPIVGGSIPLAVGHALAFKMRGEDSIAVAFLGDGATNEGVFYESLNFAKLHKLPIVFVVENNGYAVNIPFRNHSCSSVSRKARGFGFNVEEIFGDGLEDIVYHSELMVERARNGYGPSVLVVHTVRECGHVGNIDERKMK